MKKIVELNKKKKFDPYYIIMDSHEHLYIGKLPDGSKNIETLEQIKLIDAGVFRYWSTKDVLFFLKTGTLQDIQIFKGLDEVIILQPTTIFKCTNIAIEYYLKLE